LGAQLGIFSKELSWLFSSQNPTFNLETSTTATFDTVPISATTGEEIPALQSVWTGREIITSRIGYHSEGSDIAEASTVRNPPPVPPADTPTRDFDELTPDEVDNTRQDFDNLIEDLNNHLERFPPRVFLDLPRPVTPVPRVTQPTRLPRIVPRRAPSLRSSVPSGSYPSTAYNSGSEPEIETESEDSEDEMGTTLPTFAGYPEEDPREFIDAIEGIAALRDLSTQRWINVFNV
jgi:hypothetical protein